MPNLIQLDSSRPGVTVLALNRPDRRNALSIDLMRQLCDALAQLAADPTQRVAVLRGEGPVFCAGLDLREAADDSLTHASGELVRRVLQTIRESPLVTICAAHGSVLAGGVGVMAACDVVVAAEDLQIGLPEVRRGLVPALITGILRDKVRDGDLRDLCLVTDPIDVRRAQQIGLVQRIVPSASLRAEALALADCVLKGGPHAVRRTKSLLNELADAPPGDRMDFLQTAHHEVRQGDEAREGLAAFLEKRQPNWATDN